MREEVLSFLPPDAIKIGLVLAISFFVGLEHEEHKQREAGYAFGGVRSFPLIGLTSVAESMMMAGPMVNARAALNGPLVPPPSARACQK